MGADLRRTKCTRSRLGLTDADVEKALKDADGRRRGAESGLRDIKAKSMEQAEQVRTPYSEAASKNNVWLDAVRQTLQQLGSSAPDVASAAEQAATALVEWVSARNRALGEPEMTAIVADSVKKRIVAGLTDIANETWKDNRAANDQKRTKAATALKDRLQWRTWQEVQ